MTMPKVQITFRHMEASAALEAEIRRKAHALGRRSDRVRGCRVMVEAPDQHHRNGGLFHVRVAVQLQRGAEIARGARDEAHAHEDVYQAVRDAFDAVERAMHERVHGHGRLQGRTKRTAITTPL
jgi:ribosome-associated translation inhibitor RaiA